MTKILFVCHGNICRSPMAEFLLNDMAKKQGLDIFAASAATSTEEIGNPVHYGTRRKLCEVGISTDGKTAVQLQKSDYDKYDYIIGMDSYNMRNIMRKFKTDPQNKVRRLLDIAGRPADVDDPWYSGDFETAYSDILEGVTAIIDKIKAGEEL